MPPKKKATNVDDLYDIFVRLSKRTRNKETRGDLRLSKPPPAVKNLKEITCGKDIAKFKGVYILCGSREEFLETGMRQAQELEGAGKRKRKRSKLR